MQMRQVRGVLKYDEKPDPMAGDRSDPDVAF